MDLIHTNASNIQTDMEYEDDPVFADPVLDAIMAEERTTPKLPFVVMACILAITSVLSLLRGSSRGVSVIGIQPCSALYWFLSFSPVPLLIVTAVCVCWFLMRKHRRREAHNYQYQANEMQWSKKNTIILVAASFVAGLLAGLLGIGGGMIFGPLMLEFKMLPEVAAATSSFMILFTSVAAIIQFTILDRMIPDYSIWFAVLGFACSLLGQFLLTRIVKKYRKTSLIVLCVAAVIALSTVLLVTIGIMNIMEDVRAGLSFGFRSAC